MRIILVLILLPLLEIAGFIIVGDALGVGPTLLLIVASAVLGMLLLRHHGIDTLRRAQARMDRGEPPLREAFDGLCLALAGVLLFVPGFLTDILGLLLFLPPVRSWLFGRVSKAIVGPGGFTAGGFQAGGVGVNTAAGYDPGRRGSSTVIEGEFTEVAVRSDPPGPEELPPPDSRWRPPPRD